MRAPAKRYPSVAVSVLLVLAGVAACPRVSAAEDADADAIKKSCREAHEDAQVSRNRGALLAARKKLRVCAAQICPSMVRADCVEWLQQIETRIPSIVVEAKADEADVFDVDVQMDGEPLATRLDGRAIEVDPGLHTFRFTRAGSPPIEKTTIVREGERSKLVTVSWVTPKEPPRPPAYAARPAEMHRPVPATVYVLGGVGVVAAGVFTFFAVSGNKRKSELASSCAPFCADADVSTVRTRYAIGDVGLGVAVAALATATVLFATRPEVPKPSPATTRFFWDVTALRAGAAVAAGGTF